MVPHYERSTHKSYRGRFRLGDLNEDVRTRICEISSRIMGKPYAVYELHTHSKYSLPIASCDGVRYSGFNMGAGESAVFEILTALFGAGSGALLVIDEIELGLHEKAQRRLIDEMKALCNELHCQIICSTHSHVVLDALPPEGRFYLERRNENIFITPGISADYACGKLSGRNPGEVDIFVEDGCAKAFLEAWLPLSLRERIKITDIGSSEAVLRQISAHYRENMDNCLVILDGDKRDKGINTKRRIRENVETRYRESEEEINQWTEERLAYLPGDEWPEKWLIEIVQACDERDYLCAQWGVDDVGRVDISLANALRAGKHNEFYSLHQDMQQSIEQVRSDIIRFARQVQPDALARLSDKITTLLEANA